ncbi:MAG: fibronectin type III domain-containing protein [Geobacteraceae bacterium]|nr:fibronectin type III domain-containing protein [Geobacteraceae bacterium]
MKWRKQLMGWLAVASLAVLMMLFTGCGGGGNTVLTAPAQPFGLAVKAGSATATVSWTAVSGATSYNIYYGTTPGVTTASGAVMVNATAPQVITGLTDGTPYYFVVTAVNNVGESAVSNEVPATPMAKPAGIAASGGDGQVTVSWSAVAGATSYNVYYGTTAGISVSTGTKIAAVASPLVVTGLANATPYYFVVTAVNSNGESSVSSEKSATPSVAPQPPASPTGRVVTSPVAGHISVTWNAVLGATSYNVYYLQSNSVPAKSAVLAATPASSATNSIDVAGLISGATYYVLITAVNAAGESGTQTNAQAITVL